MTLTIPNTILDNTDAEAAPVQQNFAAIGSYINSEVITRDGSVAMTGALQLADGNPAASTTDVETAVAAGAPVGATFMWLGVSTPTKHLLLDGSAVSRSTYADLFALWGTTFGTGNGTTTFTLPNFKGRFPVGVNAAGLPHTVRGETGGSADAIVVTHTHVTDVNHDHASFDVETSSVDPVVDDDRSVWIQKGTGSAAIMSTAIGSAAGSFSSQPTVAHSHTVSVNVPALGTTNKTSTSAGSSGTDANLPPYISVHFIVRALP